jgi:hypothetical protein
LSAALTAGLASALPTPASASRAIRPASELANAATAIQASAVRPADARMPATAPMRSTTRPSEVEKTMLTR